MHVALSTTGTTGFTLSAHVQLQSADVQLHICTVCTHECHITSVSGCRGPMHCLCTALCTAWHRTRFAPCVTCGVPVGVFSYYILNLFGPLPVQNRNTPVAAQHAVFDGKTTEPKQIIMPEAYLHLQCFAVAGVCPSGR